MWTRFHIKCNNCDKVTNLRIQIPEKKELHVKLNCLGCKSEIIALLTVDLNNASWDFKVSRGEQINGDFNGGDYFHEFSDTLPIKPPSEEPHEKFMPTLRMPMEEFKALKETKDKRKLSSDEDWQNLKDLSYAYARFDKNVIERLTRKLIEGIYPNSTFNFNIDLDYQGAFYCALNYMIFPWIDSDNHLEFVDWLNEKIFNSTNVTNTELINFTQNIVTEEIIINLKEEISELIVRFIDNRDLFHFAYNKRLTSENYVSVEGFVSIKSFYTDCFEFIGRNSHLIFRLQNFKERGMLDAVPVGVPGNVSNASDFAALDNGKKLDILKLCSDLVPQKMYTNSFDNKIRNGINHYKAKLDLQSQIISYYPITKRPEEEYQLKYIDFINLTLDIFNSTLKVGQLIKFASIHKAFLDS